VIFAAAVAIAVLTFPYADVQAAVQKPSPHAFIQVAADVAWSAVSCGTGIRGLALALDGVSAFTSLPPARLPMRQAQTHEARGGRRG
jgi:hypothetical protein